MAAINKKIPSLRRKLKKRKMRRGKAKERGVRGGEGRKGWEKTSRRPKQLRANQVLETVKIHLANTTEVIKVDSNEKPDPFYALVNKVKAI